MTCPFPVAEIQALQMAPFLSVVVGNLVPGTLPSQGPHPHIPFTGPSKAVHVQAGEKYSRVVYLP